MILTDHHLCSLNLQPLVISSTFTRFICSHDGLVPVVFCEIHYHHPFVLQKQLKDAEDAPAENPAERERSSAAERGCGVS